MNPQRTSPEQEAIRNIISLVDDTSDVVYQDSANLLLNDPLFKHMVGKFRIGHTPSLRYIELDRNDASYNSKIDNEWLRAFKDAGDNPRRRKFRSFSFKE